MLGRLRSRIGARRYANRAGLKLIAAFAEAHPRAAFVEIGANDGEHEDLLQRAIRSGDWRGILVEPVPWIFERLRANHGEREGLIFENAAIGDRDGSMPFFHMPPASDHEEEGLPGWYHGIGSFSRESILRHAEQIPDLESRLVSTEVPTLTFDSLLAKHGVDSIDLLLVDTEGFDWEILRRVDFDRWRPRLVIYEHYHLTAATQAEAVARFHGHGYETLEEHFDTFCLRTDVDDDLTRTFRRLKPRLPALLAESDPNR
jgi:FkbM family methyltransferase